MKNMRNWLRGLLGAGVLIFFTALAIGVMSLCSDQFGIGELNHDQLDLALIIPAAMGLLALIVYVIWFFYKRDQASNDEISRSDADYGYPLVPILLFAFQLLVGIILAMTIFFNPALILSAFWCDLVMLVGGLVAFKAMRPIAHPKK